MKKLNVKLPQGGSKRALHSGMYASALAVVGFLMGAISTNQLLGQLGNFLGVGGLVSLAIVLLALPGYLYLADPLIIKPKKQPKEA